MIAGIERLREYVEDHVVLESPAFPEDSKVHCTLRINEHIDAIEREVEERYVELPKDADGETIRMGDVMECGCMRLKVMGLSETQVFCFCDGKIVNYDVKTIRHHKPPTIEDVLCEFAEKWVRVSCGSDKERELFAEYAAKLQLREAE